MGTAVRQSGRVGQPVAVGPAACKRFVSAHDTQRIRFVIPQYGAVQRSHVLKRPRNRRRRAADHRTILERCRGGRGKGIAGVKVSCFYLERLKIYASTPAFGQQGDSGSHATITQCRPQRAAASAALALGGKEGPAWARHNGATERPRAKSGNQAKQCNALARDIAFPPSRITLSNQPRNRARAITVGAVDPALDTPSPFITAAALPREEPLASPPAGGVEACGDRTRHGARGS